MVQAHGPPWSHLPGRVHVTGALFFAKTPSPGHLRGQRGRPLLSGKREPCCPVTALSPRRLGLLRVTGRARPESLLWAGSQGDSHPPLHQLTFMCNFSKGHPGLWGGATAPEKVRPACSPQKCPCVRPVIPAADRGPWASAGARVLVRGPAGRSGPQLFPPRPLGAALTRRHPSRAGSLERPRDPTPHPRRSSHAEGLFSLVLYRDVFIHVLTCPPGFHVPIVDEGSLQASSTMRPGRDRQHFSRHPAGRERVTQQLGVTGSRRLRVPVWTRGAC